jgi:signal peptidase I
MDIFKRNVFIIIFVVSVTIAVLIRLFCVAPYKVTDQEMESAVVKGDFILINKFAYLVRPPRQGDVIVFEYPEDPDKVFIKRVVGTPGDEVEIKDKKVYVNGRSYEDPHEVHLEEDLIPREHNPRDNFGPVKVPADSCFVMGDNRDRSWDSRFWGSVKNSKIKGLAFIKYWSWDSAGSRVRWGSIGRIIN